MALHFRCPACHLRMKAAPQMLADRAHHRTGTAYAGAAAPVDDTRSFACRRCDAPIERGKLVRGDYDERFPLWVVPVAPLLAAGLAYLAGWRLGWGDTAGIAVGVAALLLGRIALTGLHHGLIENRKLEALGRPATPFLLGSAIVLIAGLVGALIVGTWLYAKAGWLAAAGGLAALAVVILGVLGGAGYAAATKKRRATHAAIAAENRRQAGPR